jgi:uncharacterized protein (DUF1501 family)
MKPITRRQFLGQASCAAVGSTAFLSSLLNLKLTSSAAAQSIDAGASGDDYRALICLFLAGGNDSFNMFVPYGTSEYNEYATARGNLALARSTLLPVQPSTSDGRSFGLHPGMPEVQGLFNSGELAIVANVGTLVEPTTLDAFQSGSARLPLGLFSHSDQIAHWQTAMPDQRTAIGWGGRMADLLMAGQENRKVSMNISLSGNNLFQTGREVVSFSVGRNPEGPFGINQYGATESFLGAIKTSAIDNLMAAQYQSLLEQTYAAAVRDSIEANELLASALHQVPPVQSPFSDNPISQAFSMIAHLIAVRQQLGLQRQTFFVLFGGWDHHDEVLESQNEMLPVVSRSLWELNNALKELGVHRQVTTFTASDFGRTLSSNGNGTDHAWGGHHLVMGGDVNGKLVYGDYPPLYAGNPWDTGRGRIIPSLSVDEYFAELGGWLGLSHSQLHEVFPNLKRFYLGGPGSSPVGFMKRGST